MLNKLIILVGVSCFFSHLVRAEVITPPTQTSGLFGLAKADAIKTDVPEAFKATDKIIIAGFKIGFTESTVSSAKAGSGFGGKTTANLKLEGITDDIRQKIVDAAYADFLSKLKAANFTVLDQSELFQSEQFKSVKYYDFPFRLDSSTILNSHGMTIYTQPSVFGNKAVLNLGEIPGETGGFGFSNGGVASAGFAEKTNIRVLFVRYIVDFANTSAYGGWHRVTSSINVGQGISVQPGASLYLIGGQQSTFSKTNGNITTGQPIFSTKEFGEVRDETGTTNKVVQGVTKIVGILGGIGSNAFANYVVTAEPAKYTEVANEVVQETNKSIIQTMQALR